MDIMNRNEIYKLHKEKVDEQGRKLSWLANQLDCSYSLIHKYLNGHKTMCREKIDKIHKILVG